MNPFPDLLSTVSVDRPASRWFEPSVDVEGDQYLGQPFTARQRLFIGVILFLVIGVAMTRALQLQVFRGDAYRALADGNRIRTHITLAPRGVIYDRHGVPLTENAPRLSVALVPFDVPKDEEERQRIFAAAAKAIGVDESVFSSAWDGLSASQRRGVEPEIVIPDIPLEQGLQIQVLAKSWSGLAVLTTPRREYLASRDGLYGLSHVVGYVGRVGVADVGLTTGYARTDVIGKNGVEQVYEQYLKGQNGKQDVEVDAFGAEQQVYAQVAPEPGTNVWLTIDSELQRAVEAAMLRGLNRANGERGVAIVMDPTSGEILALASYPGFDANAFTSGLDAKAYAALATDPAQPLFNRSVQGRYPSGSTIKPVIAAAALEEKIVTSETSFLSTGGIRVGQWFFPDWKVGGHGVTAVRKALAQSVNTFFYIIGGGYGDQPGLGIERIGAYARRFGFGSKTGIDLPGEAAGLIPTPEWKQRTKGEPWYVGDTYHAAIGQGDVLVTPLQLAVATGVFANGGKRVTPHVLYEVEGRDAVAVPSSSTDTKLSQATIAVVREGMRLAVTDGSARSLGSLPISVAGKTGTAQVGGTNPTHAWFVGFAPYENPRVVITILLESVGEGSTYAVPVARDILQWWADNRAD